MMFLLAIPRGHMHCKNGSSQLKSNFNSLSRKRSNEINVIVTAFQACFHFLQHPTLLQAKYQPETN